MLFAVVGEVCMRVLVKGCVVLFHSFLGGCGGEMDLINSLLGWLMVVLRKTCMNTLVFLSQIESERVRA